jgi:hypothetical protein
MQATFWFRLIQYLIGCEEFSPSLYVAFLRGEAVFVDYFYLPICTCCLAWTALLKKCSNVSLLFDLNVRFSQQCTASTSFARISHIQFAVHRRRRLPRFVSGDQGFAAPGVSE